MKLGIEWKGETGRIANFEFVGDSYNGNWQQNVTTAQHRARNLCAHNLVFESDAQAANMKTLRSSDHEKPPFEDISGFYPTCKDLFRLGVVKVKSKFPFNITTRFAKPMGNRSVVVTHNNTFRAISSKPRPSAAANEFFMSSASINLVSIGLSAFKYTTTCGLSL
jgi:hypothetical protein